jgi:hypothetical protein
MKVGLQGRVGVGCGESDKVIDDDVPVCCEGAVDTPRGLGGVAPGGVNVRADSDVQQDITARVARS